MRVVVKYVSGRERVYEKVEKFAQAPGVMHLINVNGQPIAFIALDNVESIDIPAHETDIAVYN